jgi:hypothetical protein
MKAKMVCPLAQLMLSNKNLTDMQTIDSNNNSKNELLTTPRKKTILSKKRYDLF